MDLPFEFSQQFMITFLFVLAVVFGGLELSGIFKKNRVISAIIAVAIALFATTNAPFADMLWNYLPGMTWVFVILFFAAFAMELFGLRGNKADLGQNMIMAGAVLFILIMVGWKVVGNLNIDIPFIGGGDNLLFGAGSLAILALFYAVMKMPEDKGK